MKLEVPQSCVVAAQHILAQLEEQLFLVTIPEFAERVVMPCTHGKTREEAIRNGEEMIKMYYRFVHSDPEILGGTPVFVCYKSSEHVFKRKELNR